MGCASSKVLGSEFAAEQEGRHGSFARGISMPTQFIHHPECPSDFHIVALTSSTYGILKVDPLKPSSEEEGKEALAVKEVLNKLNTLESKADAGPQSWLEVSSMLEYLKPGLETSPLAPSNPPKASKLSKPRKPPPQQPDSVDINEIMMDIDEDTGLLKPRAAVIRRASLKKLGNSLSIRTLEELDKRNGGKENTIKDAPPTVTDFRALLKPINRTGDDKAIDASQDSSKSLKTRNYEQEPVSKTATSPTASPVEATKKNSELFDASVESYKSAFPTLSDDDWKVLELQQDEESEPKHGVQGTSSMTKSAEVGADEQSVASIPTGAEAEGQGKALTEEKVFDDEDEVIPQSVVKASPLEMYEDLCPPGGKHAVVLYTTSLRGIRKTYEDCMKVSTMVQSHGVLIDERDVSKHLEYRNELRELMERLVTVPRLFVNGKYIGGAEKVSKLQEEGQLACLFEGSTRAHCNGEGPCDGCANARFVICFECNGSRKIRDGERRVVRCAECNENGLVQCPMCS